MAVPARRVVITGLGLIAPNALHEALAGRLAAPPQPPPEITAFEVASGAPAWGFEALDFSIEKELPHVKSYLDRTSALALAAAKHALADAGLDRASVPRVSTSGPLLNSRGTETPAEIGCAYGTMFGCLDAMGIFWHKVKATNPKFAPPLPFTHGYANSPSSLLCIEYGLRGPAATFSGERLAGVEALLFAFDQIAAGAGEIILAGASESLTHALHSHLFAAGQLSRSGSWDDGLLPGEGAAMLVLENADSATKRGARIYAELDGINIFPLDPAGGYTPIQIADSRRETVAFLSTPAFFKDGSAINCLLAPVLPQVAPKLYSGEIFAVSPLLNVALAAGVLGGKFTLATAGAGGLPLLNPDRPLDKLTEAVATGFDPSGALAISILKRFG